VFKRSAGILEDQAHAIVLGCTLGDVSSSPAGSAAGRILQLAGGRRAKLEGKRAELANLDAFIVLCRLPCIFSVLLKAAMLPAGSPGKELGRPKWHQQAGSNVGAEYEPKLWMKGTVAWMAFSLTDSRQMNPSRNRDRAKLVAGLSASLHSSGSNRNSRNLSSNRMR